MQRCVRTLGWMALFCPTTAGGISTRTRATLTLLRPPTLTIIPSSPPAILTLLECQLNCPQIFSVLEVLIDSGIRRGADVLKCLCLGATAVGLGRPFLYAANYGQEGVEHLVEIIKTELETAMALVGITDLRQCEAGLVSTLELDGLVNSGVGHPYATGRRMGGGRAAKL